MLLDMTSTNHQEHQGNRRPRQINQQFFGCKLLTPEENQMLRNECDSRNYQIKAAGVAQLYFSAPSAYNGKHDHWNLHGVGVVCFIKDNTACGFFIRLFDVEKRCFCWEQELFIEIKYEAKMPYFHVFEADSHMAGLNFSNEDEANRFKEAVEHKLEMRRARVEEKKKKAAADNAAALRAGGLNNNFSSHNNNNNNNNLFSTTQVVLIKESKKPKKDKKKKLSKIDIGKPTNFVHIKHVGLEGAAGAIHSTVASQGVRSTLNLAEITPSFYAKIGITQEEMLHDPEIQRTFQKVLDENAPNLSVDALKALTKPPPVPTRVDSRPPAPLPSSNTSRPPTRQLPPIPPSHANDRSPAPPKPNRVPTVPSHKPPPPIPQSSSQMQAIQPVRLPQPPAPPAGAGAAPPPPPPPPPPPTAAGFQNGGPPAPPPQQKSQPAAGFGDPRNALLEQIRQGRALKQVEQEEKPSSGVSGGDGRDALLEQIRQGRALRPVASRPQRPEVPISDKLEKEVNLLASALAKAMADRSKATQSDGSDTSDSEGFADEEWDD